MILKSEKVLPAFLRVCPSKVVVKCLETEAIPYTVFSVTGSFVSVKISDDTRLNTIEYKC